MQRTTSPVKRSNYPLTVLLILMVHLGLGYALYRQVAGPGKNANGIELKTIQKQQSPAIP